jgi:Flp pilus assembly protein TadD
MGRRRRGKKYDNMKINKKNFNRAISLAPNEFLCYNNRGFLFAQTDRLVQAKKNFLKAFSLFENGESCLGISRFRFFF